ncbi:hypothetical protein N5D62_27270, partial [Mitsuaria sp. GD03876]|nr:hypothetical protein [Mitsuaria sp. GD03876]
MANDLLFKGVRGATALTVVAGAVGAMLFSASAWSARRDVPSNPPHWNPAAEYDTANQYVTFRAISDRMVKQGVFVSAWWTQNEAPSFISNDGPWKLVGHAWVVHPDGSMTVEVAPRWHPSGAYPGGSVISLNTNGTVKCFMSKNWTQGDNPAEPLDEYGWSPWEPLDTCPVGETTPAPPGEDGTPGTPPDTTPDPTPGTPPGTTPDPTPGTPPGTTPDPTPGTPPDTTPDPTPGTPPGTTPDPTPGTPPGTTP